MSSNNALLTVLCAAGSALLLIQVASAQPANRITPGFVPSHTLLPAGQAADLLLCVTNLTQGSSRLMQADDRFTITFGAPCNSTSFQATVSTDSLLFDPADFAVNPGASGQVQIRYEGPPTQFPFGDSFCLRSTVQTPPAAGSCRIQYQGPGGASYNAASPQLSILSIADLAPGVPRGTSLVSRGGTCPAGYTRLAEYDGYFLAASPTPQQTGGSDTHSHSAGSLQLAGQTATLTIGTATDRRWVDDHSGGDDHWVSGENHTHAGQATLQPMPVTGATGAAPHQPRFRTILICEKQ